MMMTRVRRRTRLAAVAALAAVLATSPLLAAGTNVSTTSSFLGSADTAYLSKFGVVGHSFINNVYSGSKGGIECFLGACGGAYLSWAVGANIGAFANAYITNNVLAAYSGTVSTTIGSAFPGPVRQGDDFLLFNNTKVTDGVQLFGKGSVKAEVGANLFLGGELRGDACLGVCFNPDPDDRIYNLGVGSSKTLSIFSYDSTTNSATFLGQQQTGVLPKDFQADTLPISAHIAPVDLSGATALGTSFKTTQEIGGVYVDVAQAVASVFGIPNEALSGSLLGFDYVTLSAKLGLAFDLVQQVTTKIKTFTRYVFSSPVELKRLGDTEFGAPTTSISVEAGEAVILRAGNTASLTVLPETFVTGTIDTSISLNAVIKAPIKLLEIKGNGLKVGPLWQANLQQPILSVEALTDKAFFFTTGSLGAPLTFNFLTDEPPPAGGYPGFVFFPVDNGSGDGETSFGFYTKVLNFGSEDCNDQRQLGCIQDRLTTPVFTQRRRVLDADGQPLFSFSTDFTVGDRLAGMPRGAYGLQSDMAQLERRLTSLPFNDYSLASLPAVPEPTSWTMLILGFGLVGAAAQRGRLVVTRPAA
jgi:hypothetical protein